ncbi:hypothetical protein DFH29DRAFT_871599 [Suillus ampliporus]|nr:hypothetical protein DFH29DRAFT_871599 [Suillus ampliporus]
MTRQLSRFSLRTLLETLFSSEDSTIKHHANIFLAGGGPHQLMNLWWERIGARDSQFQEWVVEKAAEICSQECSWLTDKASEGPYYADALLLRVSPKNVTVDLVKKFRLDDLRMKYERVTPRLQTFLRTIIGKPHASSTTSGRTMITSMVLNLRSRRVNLHPAITCLIMWDNQVPKRVVQLWNRYGASSSHPFQGRAIFHLSQDSLRVARAVANNGTKIKQLPYDNFNWMS